MIQRIQSVYLALVFILMAVMSFLPLVEFHTADSVFYMNIFRFVGVENVDFIASLPNIWPIPILTALLAVLVGVSITRFSNRPLQLKMNAFGLLINFGLLVSIFLYADSVAQLSEVGDEVAYEIAAYFPIVTVLLLIMANRNIRKDEKMIKEANRLR